MGKTVKDRRKLARKLFLKNGGRIMIKELAEAVGATEKTVSGWKRLDAWEKDISAVTVKSKELAVEIIADDILTCHSKNLRSLQQIFDRIDSMLVKKDLSPSGLKNLTSAMSDAVKLYRLVTNQSTENQAVRVAGEISGGVENENPIDRERIFFEVGMGHLMIKAGIEVPKNEEAFNKAAEKFLLSGNRDAQKLLSMSLQRPEANAPQITGGKS